MAVHTHAPGVGKFVCICIHEKPHHFGVNTWTLWANGSAGSKLYGFSSIASANANAKLGHSLFRAVGPFSLGAAYDAGLMLRKLMLEHRLADFGCFVAKPCDSICTHTQHGEKSRIDYILISADLHLRLRC